MSASDEAWGAHYNRLLKSRAESLRQFNIQTGAMKMGKQGER